jgi:hypothetical protein
MIKTFLEKYGRAGTEHPDFGTGIRKMGADAPMPPTSEGCCHPRQEAPAADQGRENRTRPAVPREGP